MVAAQRTKKAYTAVTTCATELVSAIRSGDERLTWADNEQNAGALEKAVAAAQARVRSEPDFWNVMLKTPQVLKKTSAQPALDSLLVRFQAELGPLIVEVEKVFNEMGRMWSSREAVQPSPRGK